MKYEISHALTPKLQSEIDLIYPQVFGSYDKQKFIERFDYFTKFTLIMAYKEGHPVGFKFGYAQTKDLFYSWTGGVIPEFRNNGIARELMRLQHDWCLDNDFKMIETRSRNKFPEMLLLNIKSGFKIMGTFTDTDGAPKIIFRKELR